MELIKIVGRKKPIRVLEWKEVKEIVERAIKENKAFYKELAKM